MRHRWPGTERVREIETTGGETQMARDRQIQRHRYDRRWDTDGQGQTDPETQI